MAVYLDNQIKIPASTAYNGVTIPTASLKGLSVVFGDTLLTRDIHWTLNSETGLFILENAASVYAEEDTHVYIGVPYDFEIEPTQITELGEPGSVKRPNKLSLYLRDSGDCNVTINDRSNKFGKTLEANERINGEHQFTTKGGHSSGLKIKLFGNGHKPFNLLSLGVAASVKQ